MVKCVNREKEKAASSSTTVGVEEAKGEIHRLDMMRVYDMCGKGMRKDENENIQYLLSLFIGWRDGFSPLKNKYQERQLLFLALPKRHQRHRYQGSNQDPIQGTW